MPPLRLAPLQKDAGVPIKTAQLPCCETTRKFKTLRQISQNAHGNHTILMACLMWKGKVKSGAFVLGRIFSINSVLAFDFVSVFLS